MKKLYEKSELCFALLWIFLYVIIMNIALQFCGGLDNLSTKTIPQMLIPVISILLLSLHTTIYFPRVEIISVFNCLTIISVTSILWLN